MSDKPKNNLKDFLSQAQSDFDMPYREAYWEGMPERIEEALKEKKSKRRIIGYWFLFGTVILGAVFWGWHQIAFDTTTKPGITLENTGSARLGNENQASKLNSQSSNSAETETKNIKNETTTANIQHSVSTVAPKGAAQFVAGQSAIGSNESTATKSGSFTQKNTSPSAFDKSNTNGSDTNLSFENTVKKELSGSSNTADISQGKAFRSPELLAFLQSLKPEIKKEIKQEEGVSTKAFKEQSPPSVAPPFVKKTKLTVFAQGAIGIVNALNDKTDLVKNKSNGWGGRFELGVFKNVGKKISISAGLGLQVRTGIQSTIKRESYCYCDTITNAINATVFTLTPRAFYSGLLPLKMEYHLTDKNALGVGYTLGYTIKMFAKVKRFEDVGESNTWHFTDGILPFNHTFNFLYRRELNKHWGFFVQGDWTVSRITDSAFHPNIFERFNWGIWTGVRYGIN